MSAPVKLPIDVAEWPKNTRETVRVRLDHFRGVNTVDVRAWWPGDDGVLRPGKGGFTVRVSHLPRLKQAIVEAERIALEQGLLADTAKEEVANA